MAITVVPQKSKGREYAGEEGDVVECQRGEDVAVDGGSLIHAAVGNGGGGAKAFGKG